MTVKVTKIKWCDGIEGSFDNIPGLDRKENTYNVGNGRISSYDDSAFHIYKGR